MTVKTGSAWAGSFVTLDATGAKSASTDAAGTLYVDGVANAAAVTITGSNPYKWSVTLPALTAGQRCDMYITGTIGTIATAGFVASEQADTALTSEVKTETAAILADTGTDGVVLKAAGLNADAVTKIQSGLALEATLTAIKGAGWDNQTLVAINQLLSNGFGGASVEDIVNFALAPIFGAGWTNQTLVKIVSDIAALATATALAALDDKVDIVDGILDDLYNTGIPAIKIETAAILEDTGTTLDTLIKDIPTNTELATALGTADDAVLAAVAAAKGVIDNIHDTDLPAVKTETAAIKAKTDNLPATPASAGEYAAAIAALQADLDNPNQYKADVSGIPAAVWGYATRTLSSFGSLIADIWSHVTRTLSSFGFTVATNSDANVTAIKAKTDNLPANTATALAAIQSDLDNPAQYKADVSGLATQASVNAIPTTPLLAANYTAPDNASIAAILEDTGTTIPATLAELATSAEVGAITMLDEVVVGSYTMQDILKILAAKMVGKATGGGTATITYRGVDDTSDVIIETVDSNGNRSAVTLTV